MVIWIAIVFLPLENGWRNKTKKFVQMFFKKASSLLLLLLRLYILQPLMIIKAFFLSVVLLLVLITIFLSFTIHIKQCWMMFFVFLFCICSILVYAKPNETKNWTEPRIKWNEKNENLHDERFSLFLSLSLWILLLLCVCCGP